MTARVTLTASFAMRRQVRARLDFHNLTWREYKGLFESSFSAEGSEEDARAFQAWVMSLIKE